MFDPITVEPVAGHAGREASQVTTFYDGEEHTVDVRKDVRVLTALASPFEELGIPPFLMESYIPKDRYPPS